MPKFTNRTTLTATSKTSLQEFLKKATSGFGSILISEVEQMLLLAEAEGISFSNDRKNQSMVISRGEKSVRVEQCGSYFTFTDQSDEEPPCAVRSPFKLDQDVPLAALAAALRDAALESLD